jgi:hypothetical protein
MHLEKKTALIVLPGPLNSCELYGEFQPLSERFSKTLKIILKFPSD